MAETAATKMRSMPLMIKGKFRNPWPNSVNDKGFLDVLKWKCDWSTKAPAFPSDKEIEEKIPIAANVDFALLRSPPAQRICATWCGHSTYFVQGNGINLLVDPIWSTRASAISFAGPKRYVTPRIPLAELPPVDLVLITHNHYDHLDYSTVTELIRLYQPVFVVPSGVKKAFFAGLKYTDRVFELTWWDSCELRFGASEDARSTAQSIAAVPSDSGVFNVKKMTEGSLPPGENCGAVRVHGVPAQHWSLRSGFDRDTVLWCGFVVEYLNTGKKAYHTGDTGYNPISFKEIGENFGEIDVAMVPIGAYQPRYFMITQHTNPEDAVLIHEDVKAKTSVGMHWGTFILTDEPIDEPPKFLAKVLTDRNIPQERFKVLAHGETFTCE